AATGGRGGPVPAGRGDQGGLAGAGAATRSTAATAGDGEAAGVSDSSGFRGREGDGPRDSPGLRGCKVSRRCSNPGPLHPGLYPRPPQGVPEGCVAQPRVGGVRCRERWASPPDGTVPPLAPGETASAPAALRNPLGVVFGKAPGGAAW